jgi:cytochrome c biogenesis protein CcdA
LRDYINGVICKICKVEPDKEEGWLTKTQRYLFAKANKTVSSEMPLILMILSIAVIAAGINMVELFCSLGFPLAYTKILASHDLPSSQYYLYLLVYIIFYMIDDFLIFLVAVFTLRITKVSEKYLKFVKLASGIALLILGLIMLLRPEILTF